MRWLIAFFSVLLVWSAGPTAAGQTKANETRGALILQNVSRGLDGVQDFVARIEANVDMERLRVPKMSATLYFKKPDKVHFDSPGFAMLPREGIVLNIASLRARYDAAVESEESIEGKKLLKLQLTAREQNVRPRQIFLWVDETAWTIVRMESIPYQGRVLRLVFTYAAQPGGYILPQTLKASFETTVRDTLQRPLDVDPDVSAQIGEARQRATRSGSITVKYLEYKVNVGLSDDIFEKKEDQQKLH